jgi:hypothetical protein
MAQHHFDKEFSEAVWYWCMVVWHAFININVKYLGSIIF